MVSKGPRTNSIFTAGILLVLIKNDRALVETIAAIGGIVGTTKYKIVLYISFIIKKY